MVVSDDAIYQCFVRIPRSLRSFVDRTKLQFLVSERQLTRLNRLIRASFLCDVLSDWSFGEMFRTGRDERSLLLDELRVGGWRVVGRPQTNFRDFRQSEFDRVSPLGGTLSHTTPEVRFSTTGQIQS